MANRNRVSRVELANTTKREKERRRKILGDARPRIGAPSGTSRPLDGQRTSLPELLVSRLPSGASRDLARMALHGLARTGNTILRAIDIPNRVFGNTRSLLQDIYERSEANLARDAYEDRSGVPQVGETAVHLASAGVLGKALPAVFGANVGADTYETAKYAGASEGEAFAKGAAHGVVDTAVWTLGQGLASKYLPKAWQWLGREIIGAGRGAASSVTSDAVLNSLGADISGEEMAKRAVHAAWMVPLLGMLKMGGKRREEAMSLLRKARPDLAGAKADKVIETIEAEFSDPKSQKVALAWVARKGANLPDDTAQIRQALEVSSKVRGLDPMSKSPFEILSNPAYTRYLPKPRPQDVKAFSNMKRYPMGVIGFDVSDDAAGRQATREMINAYMSPSSNPWCLATGKDAARLGELGPGAESYWKQHSAVPKQIFFQEVDGKLELTAFRATAPGGEGRQEYWDTSDAGYSGIPIKVKVPGDPMGRYQKMVFRPMNTAGDGIRVSQGPHPWTYRDEADLERHIEETRSMLARYEAGNANDPYRDIRARSLREDIDAQEQTLQAYREAKSGNNEVQGTFEDIAPGKVFKGDPFRDGRSQTWVSLKGRSHGSLRDMPRGFPTDLAEQINRGMNENDALAEIDRRIERAQTWADRGTDTESLPALIRNREQIKEHYHPSVPDDYVLVEDKVRTTENGITKFRTTKYADPTDRDYKPPKPGEAPKPVEIEESELVSPEWMRSRGYDPESESDVRRMQRDLDIQAWGNGAEAAMAVVPTKRTYLQTKSGTPETLTYGPNGRDVVSVDFTKDGTPYREEFFHVKTDAAGLPLPGSSLVRGIRSQFAFPMSETRAYQEMGGDLEPGWAVRPDTLAGEGYRLIQHPGTGDSKVLDEFKWDEGLGGFVRTSGNRRWRVIGGDPIPPDLERYVAIYREGAEADRRGIDTAPYEQELATEAEGLRLSGVQVPESLSRFLTPRVIAEDRQPDGTWAPAVDRVVNAETGDVVELPPPPPAVRTSDTHGDRRRAADEDDEIPMYIQAGLDEESLRERLDYEEDMERALAERPVAPDAQNTEEWDEVPFALKAGRTRRNTRAAEGGGNATETFDTPIPKELQAKYDAWYAQLPKNLQYTGDYDLQGAWLERLGQPDKYEAAQNGHLDDYGKKPNHITFSTGSKWHDPKVPERTGGEWKQAKDGSWDFYPGPGNKASDDELKAYFEKYEKGNRVHRREVRQDALGGDVGSETTVSETPVSEAPQNPGGPRIVINPQVFRDKRDALCVAFNEAFRVVMEMNGFEPASEPTEAQRKFFADTAYADDELQLRRTILARIATLDTSVKDPTDEQLEETAEMLEMVMEVGAPQNEWEQSAVKRLHDVVVRSLESTRANGTAGPSRAGSPDMV